jgi:hypothetical protein
MSSFVRKGQTVVAPSSILSSANSLPSSSLSASSFFSSPPSISSSIPGVRPWLNSTSFLSSGCSSLDSSLGGGYFLHSLNLIREDFSLYFQRFVRVFLADGLAYNHNLLLVSNMSDVEARAFVQACPRNSSQESNQNKENSSSSSSDLKIAWRYASYLSNGPASSKTSQSSLSSSRQLKESSGKSASRSLSFTYDFSLAHDPTIIQLAESAGTMKFVEIKTTSQSTCSSYFKTLQAISTILEEFEHFHPRIPTRIVLLGFGSVSWGFQEEGSELIRFLTLFRSLLARYSAVALCTIPFHHYSSSVLTRVNHLSDCSLTLDSLDHDALFADYNALMTIERFPRFNSLIGIPPDSRQYLVKAKRRLMIEKLALPPEFSRNEESQGLAASQQIARNISQSKLSSSNPGVIQIEEEGQVQSTMGTEKPISAAQIVRTRGNGCSSTHQLGGDLDF